MEERIPSEIRWNDFTGTVDAGLFLALMVDLFDEHAPNFATVLLAKLNNAWSEIVEDQFVEHELPADVHLEPLDDHLTELQTEISRGSTPRNVTYNMRALAVTLFHSALDSYARSVLPERRKASLPDLIDKSLRSARAFTLDRRLYNALVKFDASRHLVVHNQGIVTDTYVSRVMDNRFLPGELRPLDGQVLLKYTRLTWYAGLVVRHLTTDHPPSV